jgi:hypothetical protein
MSDGERQRGGVMVAERTPRNTPPSGGARRPSAEDRLHPSPKGPRHRSPAPPERDLTALWLVGWVPERLLPWPLLRPGRAGRGAGPDVREAAFPSAAGLPLGGDV